jgi:hypothetical protein
MPDAAFLNHTTLDAVSFYYMVDLSYILLISYFMTFVPTSTQQRYSIILPPYFVVAYVPTSTQRRYFDPVITIHLSPV